MIDTCTYQNNKKKMPGNRNKQISSYRKLNTLLDTLLGPSWTLDGQSKKRKWQLKIGPFGRFSQVGQQVQIMHDAFHDDDDEIKYQIMFDFVCYSPGIVLLLFYNVQRDSSLFLNFMIMEVKGGHFVFCLDMTRYRVVLKDKLR